MKLETFFEKFDLLPDAPDAVAKMRELMLQLAVQGKLVEQMPKELPARECIRNANKPVVDVAPDESVQTPAGWVALPLGCLIASNTGGGTPSKANPDYWNGTIPWASVKDIQSEKYLISTIDSITEAGLEDSSSNLISPGRLLVVTRMGLGKLAINKVPVAINQDLRAIEPTRALDLDFAYLLFKSLKMVGSGVTVKGITVDKLHAMPVLLPPLAEQKRIVAKVDELMALCNRLEAQQQERETRHAALARASLARFADAPTPANLPFLFHPSYAIPPADLRKSILTLAVQGKLVPQDPNDEPAESLREDLAALRTQLLAAKKIRNQKVSGSPNPDDLPFSIPNEWTWIRLGEAVALLGGYAYESGAYVPKSSNQIIRLGNVKNDALLLDQKPVFIPDALAQKTTEYAILDGDILVTMTGTKAKRDYAFTLTVSDADLSERRLFLNQRVGAIRPFRPELVPLINVFLKSDQLLDLIFATATGTANQANIGTASILDLPFPLPPLAEQRRIVAKVEQLMALVDALETQLAASRATGEKLLSALVAEFTNA